MTQNEAIERYIKLRDLLGAAKKKYEESIAPAKDEMKALENWLLAGMDDQGVKSLKGEGGTAYIVTRSNVIAEDWDEFINYVRENDFWNGLEKRASKSAAIEHAEEHGELPPGLTMNTVLGVNVRRS